MSSSSTSSKITFDIKKFSAEKLFHAHFVNYVLSLEKNESDSARQIINLPFRQEVTPMLSMEMDTMTMNEKLCSSAGINEKLPLSKTLTRLAREVLFASSSSPTFSLTMQRRLQVLSIMQKKTIKEREGILRVYKRRRFIDEVLDKDSVMEFNMQVLSCIISTVDYGPLNSSSMKKSLQLVAKWFQEILDTKGILSLYSEWSPPRDTEETEVPLNSRHTIDFLTGTCSKYSTSMGPRLIVNALHNTLTKPGYWQSQPEGLIAQPNQGGKSSMLIQIRSGSPDSLKKIIFYFSTQLPESVTVYTSVDKNSWSNIYSARRPYVQRKCIIYARDRMVMYLRIDMNHANGSQVTYIPHGLCGLKLYKSTHVNNHTAINVLNNYSCRTLIKDMHTWLYGMASKSTELSVVEASLSNLFKMAIASGSLCSILTIVNVYVQMNSQPMKDEIVLKYTITELKLLLTEIENRKQFSQMKNRILEKGRKLPETIRKYRNEKYTFREPKTCVAAAVEILAVIVDVLPFYMNDVYPTRKDCIVSDIDLEEPYCIEVSKETFVLLQNLLVTIYDTGKQNNNNLEADVTATIMKYVIQLIYSTFQRLFISNVNPEDAGLKPTDLNILNDVLMKILADNNLSKELQHLAANTVNIGFDVIYMESSKRVAVVTDVLEMDASSSSIDPTSGEYLFINHILKRYGEDIIDLLPKGDEYCTLTQAEEYGKPLSKFFAFGVHATIKMLQGARTFDGAQTRKSDLDEADGENNVQITASKILLNYQRHLMALFNSETSRHTAASRVVVVYGQLLCQECKNILKVANKPSVEESIVPKILRESIVGTLLPTFALHVCHHYRLTWLGMRLLPMFLSIIKSLDNLLGSHHHLKKMERSFHLHGSASLRNIIDDLDGDNTYMSQASYNNKKVDRKILEETDLHSLHPPTFSKTLMHGNLKTIDDHKTVVVVPSRPKAKYHTILSYDGVTSGSHSWDFKINNASMYIGICTKEGYIDKMGGNKHSLAMDVTDGSLWFDGKERGKLNYFGKVGDVVSMTIDLDLGVLEYSVNGFEIGKAFGVGSVNERLLDIRGTFKSEKSFAGVTLWEENDECSIRGAGFANGTLRLPWILDLQKTLVATAGMCAASMVSGVPKSKLEEEMEPWLSSQLFSSGSNNIYEIDGTVTVIVEEDGDLGLLLEESKVTAMNDEFTAVVKGFQRIGDQRDKRSKLEKCGLVHPGHVLTGISSSSGTFSKFVSMEYIFHTLKESARPLTLTFSEPEVFNLAYKYKMKEAKGGNEAIKRKKNAFLSDVVESDQVLKWIVSKDKKGGMERMIYKSAVFQRRLGAFPKQEKLVLAAFIVHSNSWQEIKAAVDGDTMPNEKKLEVDNLCEKIAAQVRVFRSWLRSQKADDWLERARQVQAEEEMKVGFDDEELEMRHRSRLSSLGTVMDISNSLTRVHSDEESKLGDGESKSDEANGVETKQSDTVISPTLRIKTRQQQKEQNRNNNIFKAMPQTPKTFEELCNLIEERCVLLLSFENKSDNNTTTTSAFSSVLYESKLAQSHTGVPSALLRNNSFEESDEDEFEFEGELPVSGKDNVKATCEAVAQYIQYGALASPSLIRLMLKLRTARIQQRISGLSYFYDLLNATSFPSIHLDCISALRQAMGGVRATDEYGNEKLEDQDEKLLNDTAFAVKNVYHYMKNVEGCPPDLVRDVNDCFQKLFKVLVELLEKSTNSGYAENSSFVQVLLDTLTLDYKPIDHRLLCSSKILKCLQKCLSLKHQDSVAKAWLEKYKGEWCPVDRRKDNASVCRKFEWNPWPPHIVRRALSSGNLSIREVVCKIRETPPNLLHDTFWQKYTLTGSLEKVVNAHTISTVLEAYDECLRVAMDKKLHATLTVSELKNLGKHCTRVQAVFRGMRARQRVSLLRDGINIEKHKVASDTTSFKSLIGTGSEVRQLRKGTWALFRFITTLAIGGNRFYTTDSDVQRDGMMSESDLNNVDTDHIPKFNDGMNSLGKYLLDSGALQSKCFNILHTELLIGANVLHGNREELKHVESLEVEAHVHSVLLFLLSTSGSRPVREFLSKPEVVILLCKLITTASPRIIGLTVQIVQSFAFRVSPDLFDSALYQLSEMEGIKVQHSNSALTISDIRDDSSFVAYLLWRIGHISGKAAGLKIEHNIFNELGKNAPLRMSSGAGAGYINGCISSTCVNLLRNMINWKKWQTYIKTTLLRIVKKCTTFLEKMSSNLHKDDLTDAYILAYSIATFGVMGGIEDMLRVGARIRVVNMSGVGRIVKYHRGLPVALVAFRESITCVPQPVPADNILPVDDTLPKEGTFPLEAGGMLINAFLQIIGSNVNQNLRQRRSSFSNDHAIYQAMPYYCELAYLRTSAIRALSIILRHGNSAIVAKDSGLLSQMFEVALRPLSLTSFVSAVELSGRLRLLQEWGWEINGEGGEQMILNIETKTNAFSSNDIEVEVPRSVSMPLVENRRRMDMAIKLWYLKQNFEGRSHSFRLCDRALETTAHNGVYNINRASAWLETAEAEETLEALRFEESDGSEANVLRWQNAATLTNQCGFPPKLCYHALELCNDDLAEAGHWLFEEATNLYSRLDYYSSRAKDGEGSINFKKNKPDKRRTVVDSSEQTLSPPPPPVVQEINEWSCSVCTFLNPSSRDSCEMCQTKKAENPKTWPCIVCGDTNPMEKDTCKKCQSNREGIKKAISSNFSYAESTNDSVPVNEYGVSDNAPLKDIVEEVEPLVLDSSSEIKLKKRQAVVNEKSDASHYDSNERDSATTVDQVKIENICTPIWPGMLLTISEGIGYEKIMEGHPGIVVDVDAKRKENGPVQYVKLGIIDQSTGIQTVRWYPIDRLRRPVELFGSILRGKATIQMKILGTCTALSTLFAREALLSMMLDFDDKFLAKDFGGGKNLLSLLKYVAAADNSFNMGYLSGENIKVDSKSELERLKNLLNNMCILESNEAKKRDANTIHSENKVSDLSNELVLDCTENIYSCTLTEPNTTDDDLCVRETLHPLWPTCLYSGDIILKDAGAMRVDFDYAWTDLQWRSKTIELSFYTDKSYRSIVHKFNESNPPKSFIVEVSQLYFKFTSNYLTPKEIRDHAKFIYKGFKFKATPIRGWGLWRNEVQVANDPSMHWACWLMNFVLNCDGGTAAKIHDPKVFEALVNYLRSPNAPFKNKIMTLLLQLCQSPWKFEDRPNFQLLAGVEKVVMERAEKEHADNLFLPQPLPSLVELVMTARLSAMSQQMNDKRALEPMNPTLDVTIPLDPPLSNNEGETLQYLRLLEDGTKLQRHKAWTDLIHLVSCLHVNARIPDHLARSIWCHASGLTASNYKSHLNYRTNRSIERMVRELSRWTSEMDSQLVKCLNLKMKKEGLDPMKVKPSSLKVSSRDKRDFSQLRGIQDSVIAQRFALLKTLNHLINGLLAWIDVKNVSNKWSISFKLQSISHTIFFSVKNDFLRIAMDMTWGNEQGSGLIIALDQMSSERAKRLGIKDPERQYAKRDAQLMFVQIHKQLKKTQVRLLRSKLKTLNERGKETLFEVQYVLGEGLDWGGLYRDAMNTIIDDLFSENFSLLIKTPNGRSKEGFNQGNYIPNSDCVSPECLSMFETLGKLMGISIRTEGFFPFKFPLMIYKLLLTKRINISDLASIDLFEESRPQENKFRRMDRIRRIESKNEFDSAHSSPGNEIYFVVRKSSGKSKPLINGGGSKLVTYKNRLKYCDLHDEERIHEFDDQVGAIRRGLSCIVPFRSLQYLTAEELEICVCGDPEIDIKFWQSHAEYTGAGFSKTHPLALRFWSAMGEFSQQQRVAFIKFAWGRSRLPSRNSRETWKFKLTISNAPITNLPLAHTCFFQIELPKYPTKVMMKERLVTAVEYGLGGLVNK
jgi:hypothetical protein